mmetsp:Transcript_4794/g.7831  ORF Transcript_4794/g.7831 Transcript_4794/m.7831 type:complete len:205 (-) Transcript_4794:549-1163(-)
MSMSASSQSLGMWVMISHQSVKDCSTNLNCVAWSWFKQAPPPEKLEEKPLPYKLLNPENSLLLPLPRGFPCNLRENCGASGGLLGSKLSFKMEMIRFTGDRLKVRYASLSAIESITRCNSSSERLSEVYFCFNCCSACALAFTSAASSCFVLFSPLTSSTSCILAVASVHKGSVRISAQPFSVRNLDTVRMGFRKEILSSVLIL